MSRDGEQPQVVVVYADGSCTDPDTLQRLAATGQRFGQRSGQEAGPLARFAGCSENVSEPLSDRFPHAQHAAILGRLDPAPRFDPHQVHREFPLRWQAYVRANFRDLTHIQQVFGVSERTARKWWKGETGANGGHVAIAMSAHPVTAQRMLFAAE